MVFKNNAKAAAALEARYADRGLKFTSHFRGCLPVQAYGHIDGKRFYFRFRHNWASLRVGPYERELEELFALRVNEDKAARLAKTKERFAAGEIDEKDYAFQIWGDEEEERVVEETDVQFSPTRITAAQGCEGPIPGDDYNGDLTPDEAYEIFSKLVESLEDVPEAEQLNEHTRVWLYEGRAAVNALWESTGVKISPSS